jgi:TetR/AcrR family transcriptional regulator, transcriptional repressor for nem operon
MARFKEFNEEVVIEQAMQLFRQRGYEATSIRDLVACTGVSSSSLYSTFGDKDAIFMLALQRHSQHELAAFRRQLADSVNPQTTVEQLFAGMIEQLLHEEVPYGSLTLKAAVELGVNKPEVASFLREYLDEIGLLLTRFLQEAVATGALHLTGPAPDVARYLLFALFNLSFMVKLYRDRASLESYSRVVLGIFDSAILEDNGLARVEI